MTPSTHALGTQKPTHISEAAKSKSKSHSNHMLASLGALQIAYKAVVSS